MLARGNSITQQKRYQLALPYATPLLVMGKQGFEAVIGVPEDSWIEDSLMSDRKYEPEKDGPRGQGIAAACRIDRSKEGKTDRRIVVVGSSKLPTNQYIDLRNNKETVRDIINWLLKKEQFSITRNFQRITLTISKTARNVIFYISVIVVPFIFLGIAVLAWLDRR
jgi:ABC-type uncharacterized transport system involved in gliding motility auxiliary subunit